MDDKLHKFKNLLYFMISCFEEYDFWWAKQASLLCLGELDYLLANGIIKQSHFNMLEKTVHNMILVCFGVK